MRVPVYQLLVCTFCFSLEYIKMFEEMLWYQNVQYHKDSKGDNLWLVSQRCV